VEKQQGYDKQLQHCKEDPITHRTFAPQMQNTDFLNIHEQASLE